MTHSDPACDLAHGGSAPPVTRALVAVFASPVASYLLHFGRDLGFRAVLVDPVRPADAAGLDESIVDSNTDVVVTDHGYAAGGWPTRPARPVSLWSSPGAAGYAACTGIRRAEPRLSSRAGAR